MDPWLPLGLLFSWNQTCISKYPSSFSTALGIVNLLDHILYNTCELFLIYFWIRIMLCGFIMLLVLSISQVNLDCASYGEKGTLAWIHMIWQRKSHQIVLSCMATYFQNFSILDILNYCDISAPKMYYLGNEVDEDGNHLFPYCDYQKHVHSTIFCSCKKINHVLDGLQIHIRNVLIRVKSTIMIELFPHW